MKFSVFELLSKVTDLILKKSKSGEKEQGIQEAKITIFKACLVNVMYVLVVLVFIDCIYPKLELSDYIYSLLDKILNYIMA
ncbi:MAG: hypothetical protein ACRCXY_08535 [Fusobacteriaceae bacterium]